MIISSKYPGTCRVCNGRINAGDRVSWTKGQRGADHAACSDEGKALAAKTDASRATDAEIDVPAPGGLSYLPYQRAGIAYAAGRPGVLIGDEMGLGKTIQAIGAINADRAVQNALVIGPKSLTINWMRELMKWLVRPLSPQRTPAPPAAGIIVVVSYEEAKKYQATLAGAWDLVIIDEAHYIKNGKAQRTKVVHAIAKDARRRILLTGTPIANRPVELFSLLQVVAPTEFDPEGKGFFRFAKRYCNARRDRFGWDFSGASNLDELQDRLRATCMVRRLKKDVLTELPAKRRQIVELPRNGGAEAVDNENRSWSAREAALEEARADLELAKAADDDTAYDVAVRRLQDQTRAAFAEIARLRHATAVAKVPHVIDHVRMALEDDAEAKLVLFAHHHDVINAALDGLAEFGAVKLTGETSLEDRQAAVDRFQKDPACRVFVGSITAAGVGITLTAAAHVVFAELDWVPGNISQAEDRCHRIGQQQSVLVQHLVFDGSLDARMAKVLVEKQRIADAGLDKITVREPAIPSSGESAVSARRSELDGIAAKLTAAKIAEIHAGLRTLAGVCNGARTEDGMGFAKIDVRIGHELATRPSLSPRQAALGWKLCRKYRRQIGVIALDGEQVSA